MLDYPREAKHEAASESAESAESEDKIGDGEEIGHRNTDASEKNEKIQSSEEKVKQKSWKVNLKKLNELRDQAAH